MHSTNISSSRKETKPKMKYNFISDDQYEAGAAIGLSRATIKQRVNTYGWTPEEACSIPVGQRRHVDEFADIAEANGIPRQVYHMRKHEGWSSDRASTQPVRKCPKRKITPEIQAALDKAESIGVSRTVFFNRINRSKWTLEEASTLPPRKGPGKKLTEIK